MLIKILGTGCPKCKLLYKTVEDAVKKLEGKHQIIKIEDMEEIVKYDSMRMPGLVIDDILIFSGGVPEPEEMLQILTHFESGIGKCCGGKSSCDEGGCCGGCNH